ncbi:unnamed protein product [Mytilus coruscus]|uniref:Uncharacterized protein n=1 Tax=Mytilus coruscus TaxID=42192 RepID=A0A6J8DDA4_MYTCO|nr:unnamed protein product [Mytilus coruscus]
MDWPDDDLLVKLINHSCGVVFIEVHYKLRTECKGDRELDEFVEWLKSALRNLELPLWRRCQRELSDVMYRCIVDNDAFRTKNKLPFQSSAGLFSQPGNYSYPGTSVSFFPISASKTMAACTESDLGLGLDGLTMDPATVSKYAIHLPIRRP